MAMRSPEFDAVRRWRWPRRRASWTLGAVLIVLGCADPLPPDQRRDTTMDVVPIFESDRQRAQQVTYYLASIEQKADSVLVDFDLNNGFARKLGAVTAWVTLHGEGGETQHQAHPVGPMGPHSSRRLVVKVRDVAFRVDDVRFGVQIAP